VLTGSSHAVHAETRRRVLAATRALGYLPNMAARSLLTRQTSAIGILLRDVSKIAGLEPLRCETEALRFEILRAKALH